MHKTAILKIFGQDAKEFLQSIITNDMNQTNSFYSLILTPTGRYLFDFFVTPHDLHYYIEIDDKDLDSFTLKLNQVKLRRDVQIEDLSNIFTGAYSKNPIKGSLISYRDPRYMMKLGYRNIVKKQDGLDNGIDLYIRDKFEYCIPDGSYDLIKEKSFPQEFGLDSLNAINFKKGCYVGQEVISRIRTQGVVRKKMFKLLSERNLETLSSSDIFYENNKVGMITSSKENLAIAQISLFEGLNEDIELQVDGGYVNIQSPEWYEESLLKNKFNS